MRIRVAEDILPGTKTAPHLAAFLSEVVQYWTAIYPELADHQRVQSTLKPILPQERNRLKEAITRNKVEGKSDGEQIEGAAKNKSGGSINAPDLEAKDEAERPGGKIQEKAGKARWKAGKAIKKAGKVISSKR
jgi:uncharacterized protein YjbJ (UPF0337 family)